MKQQNTRYNSRKRPRTASSAAHVRKQTDNNSQDCVDKLSNFQSKTSSYKQLKQNKTIKCQNVKKIGLIYAYQPKRLKDIVIMDPKSYKKLSHENQGMCLVNNLHVLGFCARFKQIRDNLKNQLFRMVYNFLETHVFNDINQVKQIAQKVKKLSHQISKQTDIVSNQIQCQKSQNVRRLHISLKKIEEYAKIIIKILDRYCQFNENMNTCVQLAATGKIKISQAQKKIKFETSQMKEVIKMLQDFCQTNPNSDLMNRNNYLLSNKIKQLQDLANKRLNKIHKLSKFIQQLSQIIEGKWDDENFTTQNIENITKVLKLRKKFQRNNQITQNYLAFPYEKQLQNKAQQLQVNFFSLIELKVKQIFRRKFQQISNEQTLQCIQSNAERFQSCRQLSEMLLKLFSLKVCPKSFTAISQFNDESREQFVIINEMVKTYKKRLQFKVKSLSDLYQTSKQLSKNISILQQARLIVWKNIGNIILNKLNYNYQLSKQNNMQYILDYCQKALKNQIHQKDLIKYLKQSSPRKINSKNIKWETIQELAVNKSKIQQIFNEQIIQNQQQIKNLLQNNHIINIADVISIKDQCMISSYEMLTRFNNQIKNIFNNHPKAFLQKIQKIFTEESQKCKESKRYQQLQLKLLSHLVSINLYSYIAKNTKQMDKIIQKVKMSMEYKTKRENQDLNMYYSQINQNLRQIQPSTQLINEFLAPNSFSIKNIKQKTIQDFLKQNQIKINQILYMKTMYQQFDRAFINSISVKQLKQWIDQQLKYCISKQKIESNQKIVGIRNKIKQDLHKKLQKLNTIIDSTRQNNLSKLFLGQIFNKKKLIQDYLIPNLKQPSIRQQNKVIQYIRTSKNILRYLKNNNNYHIAIFSKKEQPITFYYQQINKPQFLLGELQKKLQLNFIQSEINTNKLIKFQWQDKFYPKTECINFKLIKIDLQNLINFFKYDGSQALAIKNWLNKQRLQKFQLLFDQSQQSQQQLKKHLEQMLRVLKLQTATFFIKSKTSQTQVLISSLLKTIGKVKDKMQMRLSAFEKLLKILNYELEYLTGKQKGNNKIVICKYGIHGNYAHTVLLQQYESANCIDRQQNRILQIQQLFIKSLFRIPEQQNKETTLNKILQLIEQIENSQIPLGRNLKIEEKHELQNRYKTQNLIKQYISQKKLAFDFTEPKKIDYSSYKIFLNQYKNLLKKFKKESEYVETLIDNNTQFPIFCARENIAGKIFQYQQTEGITYAILPKNKVNRDYISNQNISVSKTIQQFLDLSLEQKIFSLIPTQSYKMQNKHYTKTEFDEKDLSIILNTLKVIGRKDKAAVLLKQIKQRQNLNNIKASPTITIERKKTDQTNQFMKQQSDLPKQNQIQLYNPQFLKQTAEILNKNKIQYKSIKYKGNLIGITKNNIPQEQAVHKMLGCRSNKKFYKLKNNEIQICNLYFSIGLSQKLKTILKQSKDINYPKFILQISAQNQKTEQYNIQYLLQNQLKIDCDFPKQQIKFVLKIPNKLLEGKNQKEQILKEFTAFSYKYGAKYSLCLFQQFIYSQIQKLQTQLQRQLQRQREQLQQKEKQRQKQMQMLNQQKQQAQRRIKEEQQKNIRQQQIRIKQQQKRIQYQQKRIKSQEKRIKQQQQKKIKEEENKKRMEEQKRIQEQERQRRDQIQKHENQLQTLINQRKSLNKQLFKRLKIYIKTNFEQVQVFEEEASFNLSDQQDIDHEQFQSINRNKGRKFF